MICDGLCEEVILGFSILLHKSCKKLWTNKYKFEVAPLQTQHKCTESQFPRKCMYYLKGDQHTANGILMKRKMKATSKNAFPFVVNKVPIKGCQSMHSHIPSSSIFPPCTWFVRVTYDFM